MKLERLIPILNVSNIVESFAWFEKLGWQKGWDSGDPPDFGGVCNEKCEIFLCQNGQGSRGGPLPSHVGDDDTGGVWMSWFLNSPAEVDATYELALKHGITVTWPPTDEPWGVRECHIRHPDGHTFRAVQESRKQRSVGRTGNGNRSSEAAKVYGYYGCAPEDSLPREDRKGVAFPSPLFSSQEQSMNHEVGGRQDHLE